MSDFFSEKIENAIRLASYWHQDQKRQDSEFDHITHNMAIGMMLAMSEFDEEIVVAGICHDLLNFTDCPDSEIAIACGSKVANIVEALTESKNLSLEENWKERKMNYVQNVKKGSEEIKIVATADRIVSLQVFIDLLSDYGMNYFDKFWVGPEEKLWFEDNLCMMLHDTWNHKLVKEYDKLVDELVELLEDLDEEESEESDPTSLKLGGARKFDFGEPELKAKQVIVKKAVLRKIEKKINNLPRIGKKSQKKKQDRGLYLEEKEYDLLIPVTLQLAIMKEKLDNKMIRESIKVNYLVAYKILKEMKRLQVIKRADSIRERKVNVSKAKEALEKIRK
jgi:HD domain-containing protein